MDDKKKYHESNCQANKGFVSRGTVRGHHCGEIHFVVVQVWNESTQLENYTSPHVVARWWVEPGRLYHVPRRPQATKYIHYTASTIVSCPNEATRKNIMRQLFLKIFFRIYTYHFYHFSFWLQPTFGHKTLSFSTSFPFFLHYDILPLSRRKICVDHFRIASMIWFPLPRLHTYRKALVSMSHMRGE